MEWEAIVNQHAKANKNAAKNKHIKKYSKRVLVSSVVAIFFLLATALKLVEPVLGIPVMVISLMIGCYNLGRGKGGETNVFYD
jgi:hypothetical protein